MSPGRMGAAAIFRDIPLDIIITYRIKFKIALWGIYPIVTPEKLTQDLVAGHPKSVMRQNMAVKPRLGLMHLKRAPATLPPNLPGRR